MVRMQPVLSSNPLGLGKKCQALESVRGSVQTILCEMNPESDSVQGTFLYDVLVRQLNLKGELWIHTSPPAPSYEYSLVPLGVEQTFSLTDLTRLL